MTNTTVQAIRKRLALSQAAFAITYHIPLGTLRNWEQGRSEPDCVSVNYLKMIAAMPDQIAKELENK